MLSHWHWLLLCLFIPYPAQAHGYNGAQLLLRLANDTVYLVATPSAQAFAKFDTNADGKLEPAEVDPHRQAMLAYFEQGLRITDLKGRQGKVVLRDLGLSVSHGSAQHVRVTLRIRFPSPPENLRLQYAYFQEAPLTLQAHKANSQPTLRGQLVTQQPFLVFEAMR